MGDSTLSEERERAACTPLPVKPGGFNPQARLPYGCTVDHIRRAMEDFVEFLGYINRELNARGSERIETIMMTANFSSMVGEFAKSRIARHCPGLARNRYRNGHPDLIPTGIFPGDSIQYAHEGIEVKASRHESSWQGHNPEDTWLMVFVFDSNTERDVHESGECRPFRFKWVVGAQLTEDDWSFSGRSTTSRRTITASVLASGREKMMENWIYQAPSSHMGSEA